MRNDTKTALTVMSALIGIVLAVMIGAVVVPRATEAFSPPGLEECVKHYYAYDSARDGFFGPSAENIADPQDAAREMFRRMGDDSDECDALLTAVVGQYVTGSLTTADAAMDAARDLVANRDHWQQWLDNIHRRLDDCAVRFERPSGHYNTLGMHRGSAPNVMPTLFNADPTRSNVKVLVFDCGAQGTFKFVLLCGFQPFAQLTGPPATPPPSGGGNTPGYNPPGTTPTTNPPVTTPTTQCPDWICKGHSVPQPPGCAADNTCGLGASPPSPADPVQPTAGVDPPTNPMPTPADPGPPANDPAGDPFTDPDW